MPQGSQASNAVPTSPSCFLEALRCSFLCGENSFLPLLHPCPQVEWIFRAWHLSPSSSQGSKGHSTFHAMRLRMWLSCCSGTRDGNCLLAIPLTRAQATQRPHVCPEKVDVEFILTDQTPGSPSTSTTHFPADKPKEERHATSNYSLGLGCNIGERGN